MILLIDNYDSFTYNLVAYLSVLDEVKVVRNDHITVEEIRLLAPDRIVLSPGPGGPDDSGICPRLVAELAGEIPILGVCLGHQCIGAVFGGTVCRAPIPRHGKISLVHHDGSALFRGVKTPFEAGRYHSLLVEQAGLPEELEISAWTDAGEVMGIRHRDHPLFGVQFHPESVLTEGGRTLLRNFCALGASRPRTTPPAPRRTCGRAAPALQKTATALPPSPKGAKRPRPEAAPGTPLPDAVRFRHCLEQVVQGRDLSPAEMEHAMVCMLENAVPDIQVAGFLAGLRGKGETVAEIAAAARALRNKGLRVDTGRRILVDTCGTGGDGTGTFNISTAAAFVVAGGGLPVAKHGNRSVSSTCGSADVLEKLGVTFPGSPEEVLSCLDAAGMTFLFAPLFHGAMKNVAAVRKGLGMRTLFNLLGPLANPAGATHQVLGVYAPHLVRPLAEVLADFGLRGALVVHGADGLDELSLTGTTHVAELRNGSIEEYDLTPEDLGLSRCSLEELRGGTPEENARLLLDVLRGTPGPRRDAVLLNAAAAFLLNDDDTTPETRADRWKKALEKGATSIDSGEAKRVLDRLAAALPVGKGSSSEPRSDGTSARQEGLSAASSPKSTGENAFRDPCFIGSVPAQECAARPGLSRRAALFPGVFA